MISACKSLYKNDLRDFARETAFIPKYLCHLDLWKSVILKWMAFYQFYQS